MVPLVDLERLLDIDEQLVKAMNPLPDLEPVFADEGVLEVVGDDDVVTPVVEVPVMGLQIVLDRIPTVGVTSLLRPRCA
ncbi:MAG: hypothetical protein M3462_02200 [Chloroflexota bacterium]|nr:hypothetical protein [Chloroflexota bacterium]